MDRYRSALKYDIRLIQRNRRHHELNLTDLADHLTALPESSGKARWLDQDGSLCNEQRSQELLDWHADGLESLLAMKYEED